MWRSVDGPGKPYCRMPEGLTGEVGIGSGANGLRAGTGRDAEVVAVEGGREMGAMGGGCCLGFEE